MDNKPVIEHINLIQLNENEYKLEVKIKDTTYDMLYDDLLTRAPDTFPSENSDLSPLLESIREKLSNLTPSKIRFIKVNRKGCFNPVETYI